MNAPLAVLQVSPESPGSASAVGNNITYNQKDMGLSQGFGPFLAQAYATQSLQPSGDISQQLDVESLTLQLQSLPQGGKLLPLLENVLSDAEHRGADAQQLVNRISAGLEQLQSGTELNRIDDIAAALHQFLVNVRDNQVAVDPQVAAHQTGAGATGRSLMQLLDDRLPVTQTGDKPLPAEALSNAKNTNLDKLLTQLQQQSPETRPMELSSMLNAFKRHNANPLHSVERPFRTESAITATAVTTAAAVQTSPSAPSGLPTITLATPFNQSGWDQSLGERIQWVVSHKLQGAQIKLNPAHLGPMEVRVQMHNDQASIQFTSAHGVVREALEAALPRLRDMFDASGVELVDVDVSGQSFAEQRRTADEGGSVTRRGANSEQDAGPEIALDTPLDRFMERGRLDLFV